MAQLTRDQIVSEGQLLAGRDDNATASNAWLQRWLDSVAASWSWPILQQEAAGIALAQGATSLVLGGGSGGITPKMIKILDNVYLYNAAKTIRRRIRIRHQLSEPTERTSDTAVNVGTPSSARIFTSTFGVWTFYFDVVPVDPYLLTIPYIILPDAISSGSSAPWYPNDETMVQVVAFKNHEFYDGKESPVTIAAQQMLSGLVASDRTRYGSVTGINDNLILDPTRFRAKR